MVCKYEFGDEGMSQVKRIFVEKKTEYNAEAKTYYSAIKNHLKINNLKDLRILNRYDVEGLREEQFKMVLYTVFAEANTDTVYEEEVKTDYKDTIFAVSYLPGQYNQRADSAVQCVQIITKAENVVIKNARIFILSGELTEKDIARIKEYIINPVDSTEVTQDKPTTLAERIDSPKMVEIITGFINKTQNELEQLIDDYALAMSIEDMLLIKDYFFAEKRNPTITELKVLDTYWSDHCRHTTFNTRITNVDIQDGKINIAIKNAFEEYKKLRQLLYAGKNRAVCLMDIATIYAKKAKKDGILYDLEESDEINACSIKTKAIVDGKTEDWLVMFKNETHNHPTEIEPFGGAATCLGGAIRDPLSGRSYVYQSMRVTGCADCTQDIEETIKGKLPQVKITTEAASGFSSYGNQIGLATGQVKEYYHEGFLAKRMEVGAVIAAAKAENVKRLTPKNEDIIILLGGRTGRDGIGGAVGSSKAHTDMSVKKSGSEVQKGNPVEERKLQRLFRNPQAARMIKKCNDFGAGGVSVAIGELAGSIDIFLDRVPKKYEGLDGTELAISESQERMAVLLDRDDAKAFMDLAHEENIEATIVAQVTDSARLKMFWRGQEIVNISRAFLDTNGANRQIDILVSEPQSINYFKDENNKNIDIEEIIEALLSDINTACNKGLVEQFDSTIGASNILMPFGGKYQLTPADGMASKLPVYDTETATVMTHGYNPHLAEQSLFHGGIYSVLIALSKMTAMGTDYKRARLSMQEYFEKLLDDPKKWAKPFAALLGAFEAQSAMQTPAIGGKDSMSGTFMDLNVPPNIICFAVAICDGQDIISPEIKNTNSKLFAVHLKRDTDDLPDYEYAKVMFGTIHKLIKGGKIFAAKTVANEKPLAALIKMGMGNKIGLDITADRGILLPASDGDIIIEIEDTTILEQFSKKGLLYSELATSNNSESIRIEDKTFVYDDLLEFWNEKLNGVFPLKAEYAEKEIPKIHYENKIFRKCNIKTAKPVVFIPAFPGTNCEIDTAVAFENAGAKTEIFVFNNLSVTDIMKSIEKMASCIKKSNIIALPGGFSAGDEPDGSGKFIVSIFKNELIKNAVHSLLDNKD